MLPTTVKFNTYTTKKVINAVCRLAKMLKPNTYPIIISLRRIGVDNNFSRVPEVRSLRKLIPAIRKTNKNIIILK